MGRLRERVVHSSLAPYSSNNEELSFSSSPAKLGCLVRTGWHAGLSRQMADVSWQAPILSPTSQGEYVELSDLEEFLRSKLLSIAKECRKHGKELIEHAKRLEEIACRESLTDELPDVDYKPVETSVPVRDQESSSPRSSSSSSSRPRSSSNLDWGDV